MIHTIVASHGPLATALIASATMVYGELPGVYSVTLDENAGIEGFKNEFAATLACAQKHADGVLVLCDMQSGTPWNVACHTAFSPQTTPPMAVIAGVNLPMLLQTDEIREMTDVHDAAGHLLSLTHPTLVIAAPVTLSPSDDF